MRTTHFTFSTLLAIAFAVKITAQDFGSGPEISVPKELPRAADRPLPKRNWIDQTAEEVALKSRGCLECHAGSEPMHSSPNVMLGCIDSHSGNSPPAREPMHSAPNVMLGCIDCHGGNATPGVTQRKAHVSPRNPVFWESSANPNDSSVLLNHESAEFIQFVNPGDLRVAEKAC